MIVILLLVQSIVKPITKCVDFAGFIAKGDLTSMIDIEQKNEIGILANALREMKDRIHDVLNATNVLIQAVDAGKEWALIKLCMLTSHVTGVLKRSFSRHRHALKLRFSTPGMHTLFSAHS